MKRLIGYICLLAVVLLISCGGSRKGKFAGTFTDEFNNKFVLNEDYSATIQFAGHDEVIPTVWSDGEDHKSPFATIRYNGDPHYYYLRDGFLYRYKHDMDEGRNAIVIEYE